MRKVKSIRRKAYKKRARITKKKQGKPIIVGLIHANWCGHCQTLMPVWEEMVKTIKGNKSFHIVKIESSDLNKDARMAHINSKLSKDSRKLEANGFPTIFKVKNGKLEYYDKERQADAMRKWFSS
jgi:thiol-disulfide isomerase/thioredoxin